MSLTRYAETVRYQLPIPPRSASGVENVPLRHGWTWPALIVALSVLAIGFLTGCGSSKPAATCPSPKLEGATQGECLLQRDRRIANQRDRWIENGISQTRATAASVDSMYAIDLGPYPQDVSTAYERHRQAWRKLVAAIEEGSEVDAAGLVNFGQTALLENKDE